MNDAELGLETARNEFKSVLVKLVRMQNHTWRGAVTSWEETSLDRDRREFYISYYSELVKMSDEFIATILK